MPEILNMHFTYSLCVVKRRTREDRLYYLVNTFKIHNVG